MANFTYQPPAISDIEGIMGAAGLKGGANRMYGYRSGGDVEFRRRATQQNEAASSKTEQRVDRKDAASAAMNDSPALQALGLAPASPAPEDSQEAGRQQRSFFEGQMQTFNDMSATSLLLQKNASRKAYPDSTRPYPAQPGFYSYTQGM